METGAANLKETLQALAPLDIELRLLVEQEAGGLTVRAFVADAIPDSSFNHWVRDYGKLLFISHASTIQDLGDSLASGSGRIQDMQFTFPAPSESVSWNRAPSYGSWDPRPVPWPLKRIEVNTQDGMNWSPPRYFLIADGEAPSFLTYSGAALYYLYGVNESRGPASFPSTFGVIRIAEPRGRIRRVELSTNSVTAFVDAHDPNGMVIEIASPQLLSATRSTRLKESVGVGRRRTLHSPRGIPDDTLLLLTVNGDWVDYRWLGARYGSSPDIRQMPADASTSVRAVIVRGEGPTTDFKRELPDNPRKRSLLKSIAAFASQPQGGTIIFGVGEKGDDDEGQIIGLPSIDGADGTLHNMFRDRITPEPSVEIQSVRIDGMLLLVVDVSYDGTPHALMMKPTLPEFFVRRGSNTFPAHRDEIRSMFQSELQQAQPDQLEFPGRG